MWPVPWRTIFIISLDGVHCRVDETSHPTLSKDPEMYSHKFNGPGVAYEFALDVFSGRLVHMKGPAKAGMDDLTIYRSELKDKIPAGKLAIVDGGYKDFEARPNSHDSTELRNFRARARARQEAFNSRLKRFHCLTRSFRHSMDRHKIGMEAICVICQFEIDLGTPLSNL